MKKLKIKKSTLISIVFIAAVLLLTLWSVLKGENPADLLREMRAADGKYLLLAVLCVMIFDVLQGVIIYLMCRSLDLKESLWRCILMAFHGYFFCNITPMQSGGPVIQIHDMKKEGIRVPMACMIIFNMTFLYKAVLFVITILLILFGWGLIRTYMWSILPWFIFGVLLTISFTILIGLLIFNTQWTKRLAVRVYHWAVRRKIIKDKDGREEKLLEMLDQYKDTAGFFLTHLPLMALLFGLTVAQRFCYFTSTYFVYRSFGFTGTSWLTICLLHATINIIADILPVPGDAGVSEAVFSVIFEPIFLTFTGSGLLLSRLVTYYAQILICGIMTIVASVTFRLDRSKLGRYKKSYYDPEEIRQERRTARNSGKQNSRRKR